MKFGKINICMYYRIDEREVHACSDARDLKVYIQGLTIFTLISIVITKIFRFINIYTYICICKVV